MSCARGHDDGGMRACAACEGERNRATNERLRDKIRDVKARLESPHTHEDERQMLRELHALGHPEPEPFMRAVQARLDNPRGRKR